MERGSMSEAEEGVRAGRIDMELCSYGLGDYGREMDL